MKVGQTLDVNVAKKSTRAKSPRRDSAPAKDSAVFAKELLSIKRTPPNLVASKKNFWAQEAFHKEASSTSKQSEPNKEKPVENKGKDASKSVN